MEAWALSFAEDYLPMPLALYCTWLDLMTLIFSSVSSAQIRRHSIKKSAFTFQGPTCSAGGNGVIDNWFWVASCINKEIRC